MTDVEANSAEFTEDDIIFECPFCTKSMAIDKRGMGLTINCPQCDGLVRVPTVSEATGANPDSVSMPVDSLADALEESREELEALQSKLSEVETIRGQLEVQTREHEEKLTLLRREFGNIQSALDQVTLLVVDSAKPSADL